VIWQPCVERREQEDRLRCTRGHQKARTNQHIRKQDASPANFLLWFCYQKNFVPIKILSLNWCKFLQMLMEFCLLFVFSIVFATIRMYYSKLDVTIQLFEHSLVTEVRSWSHNWIKFSNVSRIEAQLYAEPESAFDAPTPSSLFASMLP